MDALELIFGLMAGAERDGYCIWLQGGWAVDARLGRITREHGDIDLAVPRDRLDDFWQLLKMHDCGPVEHTDYGFLVQVAGHLLDCEPCEPVDGGYEVEGCVKGACPPDRQGQLRGTPVFCTTWAGILWDYFYYQDELPQDQWPLKDQHSYDLICSIVGADEVAALRRRFSEGTAGP
jgi:aminoglycoside 2''-adenylyltransferase